MIGNTLRREKVEISLLNSFSRKCIILEKERVSDGEGGYITTWKDGAEFENYMAIDTSMEARIAEKQGVTSVYSALVGISVPINYGDYFRDVEYMTGVFLTALMWLSPIMYAIDSISEPLRTLVSILPMTTIVEGFHDVMYNQQAPDLVKLGGLAVFSIILLIVCELVFMKLERNFAEEM